MPHRCRSRRQFQGISYIEVLVALVLLAVCLVPAMDAMRNASATPAVTRQGTQALACVKSRMESVAAEPYQNLLNAAGEVTSLSAYSLPKDSSCPARAVMIARYNPDSFPYYMAADTGLLYISVSIPGPSGEQSMPLVTMVAR
jgi:Tfp pilus assembly protein PilV